MKQKRKNTFTLNILNKPAAIFMQVTSFLSDGNKETLLNYEWLKTTEGNSYEKLYKYFFQCI